MFDFELFRDSQITNDDLKKQCVALLRLLLCRIESDGSLVFLGHKERLMPTMKVLDYMALVVGRKFQNS